CPGPSGRSHLLRVTHCPPLSGSFKNAGGRGELISFWDCQETLIMDVRPLTGALGAEIFDIDLAQPLDDRTLASIRAALLNHLMVVFRDQRLTPEQQASFARRFGPLHTFAYTAARALPGHPEVLRVVKEKEDRKVFGELWHADVTFLEKPVLGSMLYA